MMVLKSLHTSVHAERGQQVENNSLLSFNLHAFNYTKIEHLFKGVQPFHKLLMDS